ncbi:MAG: hypothetical protein EP330_00160 [Deltaproteobacteria bacterium]|nr:MAG: hypothetical protein EP330_00160 [Deltaproteobacteria bacterium]
MSPLFGLGIGGGPSDIGGAKRGAFELDVDAMALLTEVFDGPFDFLGNPTSFHALVGVRVGQAFRGDAGMRTRVEGVFGLGYLGFLSQLSVGPFLHAQYGGNDPHMAVGGSVRLGLGLAPVLSIEPYGRVYSVLASERVGGDAGVQFRIGIPLGFDPTE